MWEGKMTHEEIVALDRRLLERMGFEIVAVGRNGPQYECVSHEDWLRMTVKSPSRTWDGSAVLRGWLAWEHHWHYIEEGREGENIRLRVSVQEGRHVWEAEAKNPDPRAALALAADKLPMEEE